MLETGRPTTLKEAAMSQGLRGAALVFVALCVVAPVVEAAQGEHDQGGGRDQGGFSVRDVQGPTAFAFDGFVTVGAVVAPAASVGRFVADGNGHLRDGVRTLVVAGTTLHQTFTCDYTVNANGTGSATCVVMTGAVPSDESFDFVIVERKKQAFFTATTPGATLRGVTKLQQ
jgi:hypothetical protein